MGTKKAERSLEKSRAKRRKLKKRLSEVQARLTKTEKKLAKSQERAERWKQEAKSQRGTAVAEASAGEQEQDQPVARSADGGGPEQAPAEPTRSRKSQAAKTRPDETWTVVQLRDEARSRGLTGLSNKSKADLLAALS